MLLIAEVRIGVHGEELGDIVVIAGIVPPPTGITSQPLAHHGEVRIVGYRPHVAASDVYAHLLGHAAQGIEEALALFRRDPREGIELRHIVQGAHGISRRSFRPIPSRIHALLQLCQAVCAQLQRSIIRRHTHIIHKDAELPYAQRVHIAKLMHNLIHHLLVVGISECRSRVNGPDEVHLHGLPRLCDVTQHIL